MKNVLRLLIYITLFSVLDQATGRGCSVIAGTAGYCVGNLNLEDHELPWEDETWEYPKNLAMPKQIEIDASNGASDYGNKFGEPVVCGFTRSFGLRTLNGERREWIKPIMFSGGIGQLDDRHSQKGEPKKGMWVVKIGGPAYRYGIYNILLKYYFRLSSVFYLYSALEWGVAPRVPVFKIPPPQTSISMLSSVVMLKWKTK